MPGRYGDPVVFIRSGRSGGRAVARVADELSPVGERTDEFIVPGVIGERLVEQLERHFDLVGTKRIRGLENLGDAVAIVRAKALNARTPERLCCRAHCPPCANSASGYFFSSSATPDSRCASAHSFSFATMSRGRLTPSWQISRMRAEYGMPATPAMRARPASGAMSGFAFTSR